MTFVDDGNGHTRTALTAYYLGALSPEDATAVEAHLAGCAECLAEYEALGPLVDQLDRLADPEDGR